MKRIEFEKDPFNAGEASKYLTGYQFEMVEEQVEKLTASMESQQTHMDTLQKKLWYLMRPLSAKANARARTEKVAINLFAAPENLLSDIVEMKDQLADDIKRKEVSKEKRKSIKKQQKKAGKREERKEGQKLGELEMFL